MDRRGIVRPLVISPGVRADRRIGIEAFRLPRLRMGCALTKGRSRHDVAQPLVDHIPGDDLPPGAEVLRAAVPVFQVVRVLPDIAAEEPRSPVPELSWLGSVTISRRCREGLMTRNAHPAPKCDVAASVKRD
jgi:hypothetical protein